MKQILNKLFPIRGSEQRLHEAMKGTKVLIRITEKKNGAWAIENVTETFKEENKLGQVEKKIS